jgi:hypothetical protein
MPRHRKRDFGEINAPSINSGGTGNEGVGEHVRTRFHLGLKIAGEIAELRDPHRTKKTDFFCRTGFRTLRSRSSRLT